MEEQHQNDQEATEVRATEQSKGGIKYDLVLADSSSPSPLKHHSPNNNRLSANEIALKLQAAEERKRSLDAQRLNQLNELNSHLSAVLQKKAEYNHQFIQVTKDNLEHKIEGYKENREARIQSIKEKLKEHDEHVQEVRKSLTEQQQSLITALQKKMETADEIRTTQIKALQERLIQHDNHIAEVRKQMNEQISTKRTLINKKLEDAQAKRELILKEIQEKMQEHEKHILQVKQLNELKEKETESELERKIVKKLCKAEVKRLSNIQALQERLQEHEKHVEEVRQNKQQGTNTAGNSLDSSSANDSLTANELSSSFADLKVEKQSLSG